MSISVRSVPGVVAWRGRNRILVNPCAIENLLRESKNLVSKCMQQAMTPRPLPDFIPIKYKKNKQPCYSAEPRAGRGHRVSNRPISPSCQWSSLQWAAAPSVFSWPQQVFLQPLLVPATHNNW